MKRRELPLILVQTAGTDHCHIKTVFLLGGGGKRQNVYFFHALS